MININNTLQTKMPISVGSNSAGSIDKIAYARPVSYYYNLDTNKWEVGIKYWYEVETIENGVSYINTVQFFSEIKRLEASDISFMWNNVVPANIASLSHELMLPQAVVICVLTVLNGGHLFDIPVNSWEKRV